MGRIAFLFAGQGAQRVGMGSYLTEESAAARAVFDLASELLGYDVPALLSSGPEERLAETEVTQPTVLAVGLATASALAERGVTPDMAAGLSLGEYGALVASGALSAEEAIPLVRDRGVYMQEAVPLGEGGMVAVLGMEAARVEEIAARVTEGVAAVANYNCPGQQVVAGDVRGLEAFKRLAADAGARRLVNLPVSAPFHSSLLEPAARRLGERMRTVAPRPPQVPVYANLTGRPVAAEAIVPTLVDQVSHPVLFEASLRRMAEDGADLFIEVGPGKSLGGFVKKTVPGVEIRHTDDAEGFEKAVEAALGRAKRA